MKNRYLQELKDLKTQVLQNLNDKESKEFIKSFENYRIYMSTIVNYCYEVYNSYEEVIDIHKEYLDTLSEFYKKDKKYFFKYYYNSLNYHLTLLSDTYDNFDDVDIHKEILKIVNKHVYSNMASNFDEIYESSTQKQIYTLENLVDSLRRNKLYQDSITHQKKLTTILENQYIEDYDKLIKNLNNQGNIALQLKNFEESFSSYKSYFLALNLNISIKTTDDLWKVVYTFVKYYQAATHFNKDLKNLDFQIKNLIYQLKLMFEEDYKMQIEKYYLEYLKAKSSKDEFTREKYSIFMKLFKDN